MFKAFLRHNAFRFSRKSTTSQLNPLWPPFPYPSKFFCTSSSESDPHSFAVSYLINNIGFTANSALKASKILRFTTSHKPDSVIAFFRNHGFSDSDISDIIKREPWLLACDVNKRISPKLQFLFSKGASPSDVLRITKLNPRFMKFSFENAIIPTYELINSFLQSDVKTLGSIVYCPSLLSGNNVRDNIKLLVDNGMSSSNIFRILRLRPYILCANRCDLENNVQELKNLGFCPSKIYFADALLAKRSQNKFQWNEKIDTYKKWGWSEETIMEAFRRQPACMLVSSDKINKVMQFWVNQLSWDFSYLARAPGIFKYSLENYVIPRALVVQYLLSKGLRSKSDSLVSPFFLSEKLFLQRYVNCFEEKEKSRMLKLFRGKINVEDKRAHVNHDLLCS